MSFKKYKVEVELEFDKRPSKKMKLNINYISITIGYTILFRGGLNYDKYR
jgi:hypothetical protein